MCGMSMIKNDLRIRSSLTGSWVMCWAWMFLVQESQTKSNHFLKVPISNSGMRTFVCKPPIYIYIYIYVYMYTYMYLYIYIYVYIIYVNVARIAFINTSDTKFLSACVLYLQVVRQIFASQVEAVLVASHTSIQKCGLQVPLQER